MSSEQYPASQRVARALVAHFGNQARAAEAVGYTRPTVNEWVKGKSPIGAVFRTILQVAADRGDLDRWGVSLAEVTAMLDEAEARRGQTLPGGGE